MRFIKLALNGLPLAVLMLASSVHVGSQQAQVLRSATRIVPGGAGPFDQPMAMATDQAGNIYVLDYKNHRLVVFSPELKFLRQIGGPGQGPGEFLRPLALAISRSGEIFVADSENFRVQWFNPSGRALGSFPVKHPRPPTLAVNSRDEIFMSESYRTGKVVSVYDKGGRLLRTFGDLRQPKEYDIQQKLLTQYVNEAMFAVDAEDNLLVTFRVLPALRKYDREGRLVFETDLRGPEVTNRLEKIKQPDKRPRLIGRSYQSTGLISGVAVDSKGRIWVLIGGPIYLYNQKGEFIGKFKTEIEGRLTGFDHILIDKDRLLGTSTIDGCWAFKLPAL